MIQPFLTHAVAKGYIDELRLEAQRECLARPRSGRGPRWAEFHAQSDTPDERTES